MKKLFHFYALKIDKKNVMKLYDSATWLQKGETKSLPPVGRKKAAGKNFLAEKKILLRSFVKKYVNRNSCPVRGCQMVYF
jgi:hypothetical protein